MTSAAKSTAGVAIAEKNIRELENGGWARWSTRTDVTKCSKPGHQFVASESKIICEEMTKPHERQEQNDFEYPAPRRTSLWQSGASLWACYLATGLVATPENMIRNLKVRLKSRSRGGKLVTSVLSRQIIEYVQS